MNARHSICQPGLPGNTEGWPVVDDELLKALTPVTRAVVRALGFARAVHFLRTHGGVSTYVPLDSSRALGISPDELARLRSALAPHLGSSNRLALPKVDRLLLLVRNAQIRRERYSTSLRTLARRHNLTDRHIMNLCREDDASPSLF